MIWLWSITRMAPAFRQWITSRQRRNGPSSAARSADSILMKRGFTEKTKATTVKINQMSH